MHVMLPSRGAGGQVVQPSSPRRVRMREAGVALQGRAEPRGKAARFAEKPPRYAQGHGRPSSITPAVSTDVGVAGPNREDHLGHRCAHMPDPRTQQMVTVVSSTAVSAPSIK